MRWIAIVLVMATAVSLSGCSKFKTYTGPEVTRVLVYKESRKMYLMHDDQPLKIYDVDLGFSPDGHKQFEGDGRTPEGNYFVDRRNPNSEFYLSIGISYPNAEDRAYAQAQGKSPGGDIFIHGNSTIFSKPDWTAGCIAVSNAEMRDVYAMVNNGTLVSIYP